MGLALNNRPIQIVGCIFMVLLLIVWAFVFGMMIRAVRLKQILWPQKQEDKDEGRWVFESDRSSIRAMQTDVESMFGQGGADEHEELEVRVTRASTGHERRM